MGIANDKNWKQNLLNEILDSYIPKYIFDADQTDLVFKCLPTKAFKHQPVKIIHALAIHKIKRE